MNWLRNIIGRTKPERLAADYLYEARVKLVEAEVAAEEWAARVSLYRTRIERLEKEELK